MNLANAEFSAWMAPQNDAGTVNLLGATSVKSGKEKTTVV